MLDRYTFGQPEIVLAGRTTVIDGWLPDSQRLLVTQDIPDATTQRLEVKTVDVRTKVEQRYAERVTSTRAVWLSAEQAVAFAEVQQDRRVVLRIARGAGAPVEDLAGDLAVHFVSVRADGQEVAVFTTSAAGQPQAVAAGRAAQRGRRALGPMVQAMEQPVELKGSRALRTAWSPDGTRLAVFNDRGFYLVDIVSKHVCTVDLGSTAEGLRWARDVRWSPDSRLIAARTTITEGDDWPSFLNLTVLDTMTGHLQQVTLDLPFVDEAEWLPTSQQMLVEARVEVDGSEQSVRPGLFLVDVVSGAFRRVLPDTTFGVGLYTYEGGGLAVSPNGRRAAVKCPLWPIERTAIIEDRVCTIAITLQP